MCPLWRQCRSRPLVFGLPDLLPKPGRALFHCAPYPFGRARTQLKTILYQLIVSGCRHQRSYLAEAAQWRSENSNQLLGSPLSS